MNLELRRGLMVAVGIPKDAIIVAERSDNDAALMDVIYAQGWSASPKYMRQSEAEKVTNIGTAFKGNTAITDFSAFKYFTSVTSIGTGAFHACTNLALTSLPSGLTSIGNQAFQSCKKLALTELPSGVKSIGIYTFLSCTNLALTELPSGVTSIGTGAFQSCTNLALTELPSGVRTIGVDAFQSCTNLALTELPSGVTSIGNSAFYSCSKLSLTSLPSGMESIGNSAFFRCSKITNIRILNTTSKITSGTNMFTSAPTIEVPSTLLADYQADKNWNVYTLVGY